MKHLEHREIPNHLVEAIIEETDLEKRQALLQDLAKLLSCVPMKRRIQPFIAQFPKTSDSQETLKQFAVLTLEKQLSYWQFYRSQLKSQSLADYLNVGELLPLVSSDNSFFATVVTIIEEKNSSDDESYLMTSSFAGDGDFWGRLADEEIKASVLLGNEYSTNDHPVISSSEIGITKDQVQKLIQARNDYKKIIILLFSKNITLQIADGYLPESVRSANSNPGSIYMSLYRHFGDQNQADEAIATFSQKFNEYVSEDDWAALFSCLDIMIMELQKLVEIAHKNT